MNTNETLNTSVNGDTKSSVFESVTLYESHHGDTSPNRVNEDVLDEQVICLDSLPTSTTFRSLMQSKDVNKTPLQRSKHRPRDERYLCQYCGKAFSNNHCLSRHSLIHTGERPFACKVCRKTFNRKYTLTTHERLHTGERPYVCKLCGMSFKWSSYLLKHTRNMHNE